MTIICGVQALDGSLIIGSDSLAVNGWGLNSDVGAKMVCLPGARLAIALSGAFIWLLRARTAFPKLARERRPRIEDVADMLLDLGRASGLTPECTPGEHPSWNVNAIFACPDGVFLVDSSLGYDIAPAGQVLCGGSGSEAGVGAAFGRTARSGDEAERTIRHVLRAAMSIHNSCGGTAHVVRF